MMIDRRTFVAGTALIVVAPTVNLLPVELPNPERLTGQLVLMIDGWSVPDECNAADTVWIRIGRSWQVAWR